MTDADTLGPHDDDLFVPVQHRLLGLDRRTIPPALAVLALVVIAAVVLPGIARSVESPDLTGPGDRLLLARAGELTAAAPEGWDLTEGVLVGDTGFVPLPVTAELARDGVVVTVTVAEFDGTPDELMDRVSERNARQDDLLDVGSVSQRSAVVLENGTAGVVEVYTGLDRKGVVMTFVLDLGSGAPVGVEITAVGDIDGLSAALPAITEMVESLTVTPATTPPEGP